MLKTSNEKYTASSIKQEIRASRVLVYSPTPKCFSFTKYRIKALVNITPTSSQKHCHLLSILTQAAVEHLFTKTLTNKVKALSKWKSIDIQRIHQHDTAYRRISKYLTKQTTHEHLSLDPFSSDLLPTSQRTQLTQ